ncbi:MAG: heparinase II/III family protein [Alphaproteobacteria bacterium]|nr:heparinase II/III family protein [Alphaproteobacteria bacterium]
MESPAKLLHQIKRRVQSVTYGSPIYRMMLDQGPLPERLRLSVPDIWPGDAKQGQTLIASPLGLFDLDETLRSEHKRRLLTHDGLRDLRAVGSEMARRKCVSLIHEWIEDQEPWDEDSWAPGILGARLANWIAFYDFYGSAASHDFTKSLILNLVRQLRHLQYTSQANLIGVDGLWAIKGLIYGGLCVTDGEKSLSLALDLLKRQLDAEILTDGGHISRNPQLHADLLRVLIDLRTALTAAKLEVPHELSLSIARMIPVLKLFRHGDGGLALFNGAQEASVLHLDATLTLSQVKGRILKRLPHMGYERMTAGRSLLLVDVSGPPPRGYDQAAHAGLMSFEFSVGKERILTNCGAGLEGDPAWHLAMASTAAHNTMTLSDTNACELLPDGGIGHRPRDVVTQRYEQEGVQFIEVFHDGYMPKHKVGLQRILGLAEEGDELRGREVLAAPIGKDFTVRWHIHPDVSVMLAHGGASALLRTLSGAGWRLRVYGPCGGDLALETSVYCGKGVPRRTLQLRVSGRTIENPMFIEWTLTREKTKKGK